MGVGERLPMKCKFTLGMSIVGSLLLVVFVLSALDARASRAGLVFRATPLVASLQASTTITRPADGAELLYAPAAITSVIPSAQNPSYSPDGQSILFTQFDNGYNIGPAGLYTLALATQTRATLLYESGQDSVNMPGSSWNAAINRIAFSSDRRDTTEIWMLTPDALTSRVAPAAERVRGAPQARPTRDTLTRVTTHTTPFVYDEPTFSPDGQWLVFEVKNIAPSDQQRGTLWKVRADGTGLTPLTFGTGNSDDRQPNWSPIGNRIVFQRRVLGSGGYDWRLYTMDADGNDVRALTSNINGDTDASWSPDGRWLIYSSNVGGLPQPNLHVFSVETGAIVRITRDDTSEDSAPAWSPDGQWIAFESHSSASAPAALWRIRVPSVLSLSKRCYLPVVVK